MTNPLDSLPQSYTPGAAEADIYRRWVDAGYFTPETQPNIDPARGVFSLVIPPPNVTGVLHMGHAFEHSLMDGITRFKRMQGYQTCWVPGTDHAGIAMQNVVERAIGEAGQTRHDLGREAFIDKVWEYKQTYGGGILDQMKLIGDGVDWTRERFTMDDGLSRAVRTMFGRMYHDDLIYRAERIINWCPRCHTALSDVEVDSSDDDGELISVSYGPVTVATTRVETMLGDTAVAVHPDDERYAHLVGTEIELPLTGRMIPIIADAHVDPSFGTGAVKVTPAHDTNDFDIASRHDLPAITVLDESAIITWPGPFAGLDRFEARAAITQALREEGRIVAEKRPYVHAVPHCNRCKTVVEPRLSLQWFVKTETLAQAAGDAVRDGRTKLLPASMESRYFAWVDNMHDWCISRQLWWGHRIPVWYCPDGHVTVPAGVDTPDPTVCDTCGKSGLEQDPDVLDTWFSSGLWPFSTLGWPDSTADLATYYPTSALVVGYDIIFFWVARMMMFGLYAMGDVPFREVMLHGLVRDQFGKKMSKSWGNTVDPIEWISKYGADPVRFTLLRGANPGTDVPTSEEWVQGSRNFANKLWNATRFALMNGAEVGPIDGELSLADRWILTRLDEVTSQATTAYNRYEFAKASDALFHFAWDDVCDWYVELSKLQLRGDGAPVTRRVLGTVFDRLLRLLHPAMPFVTEQLWTALTGGESLVIAPWPSSDPAQRSDAAIAEMAALQQTITEIRRFRADQGMAPGKRIPARISYGSSILASQDAQIRSLTRLEAAGDEFTATASLKVDEITVELDLSGLVDVAAETARLEKDLAAANKELAQVSAKLDTAQFMAKAPEPVVTKMKTRREVALADIARIEGQIAALAGASGAAGAAK